jgi:YYY domain-containing protein
VIAYELLFVAALIGWAVYRAHVPDLGTTEKPMEFAFFNAIGRSPQFPPNDPWLSGYAIAYYYFGYVMMSLLQQLTGVTAGTAFSLSNAFWFALSAISAFAVVANLVLLAARQARRAAIVFGLLGALMLVVMGNFEAPLEVARVNGVGSQSFYTWLDILDLNQPYVPAPDQPNWPPRFWWWWRASRVIHDYWPNQVSPVLSAVTGFQPTPNTEFQEAIDEFPQFSFLLGDMHPHVLALPFALLMMGLALNLYQAAAGGEIKSLWWGRSTAPLWPLYALAVGSLGFLNTWDFPIYAFVLAAAYGLGRWQAGEFSLTESGSDLFALGVGGAALYIPFYRGFTSQAGGIAPNLYNGTRASQFFVMFGPFILIGLALGIVLVIEAARVRQLRIASFAAKAMGGGIGLIAAMSIIMAALAGLIMAVSKQANDLVQGKLADMSRAGLTAGDQLLARLADPWVPLALGAGLVAIWLLWRARRSTAVPSTRHPSTSRQPIDFVLLLYAIGVLLTFGVEFAYIIDGFGTRMNTVFKFYYQAWALWSVASAFGAYYLLQGASGIGVVRRVISGVVVAVVVVLGLFYPVLAIPDKLEQVEPTLDAMASAGQSVPDEYQAAQWFNQTVPDAPVIMEAPGDEYNPNSSRMSTWTGLPSVMGWSGHENQWRNSYDVLLRPRIDDVKEAYATPDVQRALAIIHDYNVRYVVVGPNERRQFAPAALAKFDQVLPIVFQQGDVTIYRVP